MSSSIPVRNTQTSKHVSPDDVSAPAANTDAVVSYTGSPGRSHCISGVAWSYSGGDPTAGNLKIEDGGNLVFSMDITAKGAGYLIFPYAKRATVGNDLVITLAAGGTGVSGKVNVLNHWME